MGQQGQDQLSGIEQYPGALPKKFGPIGKNDEKLGPSPHVLGELGPESLSKNRQKQSGALGRSKS